MNTITTKDSTQIYFKDGAEGRTAAGVSSWMAVVFRRLGHSDAVLRRQGYRVVAHDRRGQGVRARSATATTWTTMPPTPPSSSSTSTCAMPSTSAIRLVCEATRYVARHGEPQGVWRNSCSSAPYRRSWSRLPPIRAACPSRFWMACGNSTRRPRTVLPRVRKRSLLRFNRRVRRCPRA